MTAFASNVAAGYERWMVPLLFEPYARDLAMRAERSAPGRVLEIAAGTGALTRELAARLPHAAIVATDLEPAMLERAAAHTTTVAWQLADAQALPFADASFDLVACQFGVMFFPDRPGAFAQMRRVLELGGRALVSTWDGLATNAFAREIDAAVAPFVPAQPSFFARVPHAYCDRTAIRADLAAAGFDAPVIDEVVLTSQAPSPEVVAWALVGGTPLRGELGARFDDAIAAATARIRDRFGPGPVSGDMTAFVIEVTR